MTPLQNMIQFDFLTWHALIIGWERNWINKQDAINFAVDWLIKQPDTTDNRVLQIAGGDFVEVYELRQLVQKFANDTLGEISESEVSDHLDRWRLSFLMELAQAKIDDETKLKRLQEIYAEFEYPEDLVACSPYYIESTYSHALRIGDQVRSPLDAMNDVITLLKSNYSGMKQE